MPNAYDGISGEHSRFVEGLLSASVIRHPCFDRERALGRSSRKARVDWPRERGRFRPYAVRSSPFSSQAGKGRQVVNLFVRLRY